MGLQPEIMPIRIERDVLSLSEFTATVQDALAKGGPIAITGTPGTLREHTVRAAAIASGRQVLAVAGPEADFSARSSVIEALNLVATVGPAESVVLLVTDADRVSAQAAEDLAGTQAHLALQAVVMLFPAA